VLCTPLTEGMAATARPTQIASSLSRCRKIAHATLAKLSRAEMLCKSRTTQRRLRTRQSQWSAPRKLLRSSLPWILSSLFRARERRQPWLTSLDPTLLRGDEIRRRIVQRAHNDSNTIRIQMKEP
jgi:hypothetical protein